jgi:hypothetical protein
VISLQNLFEPKARKIKQKSARFRSYPRALEKVCVESKLEPAKRQLWDKMFARHTQRFTVRFFSQMSNPRVFFDITIGGTPAGRIIMELRADVVPRTAGMPFSMCFLCFC